VNIAYLARDQLGSRWWRLLFLALLWSGLSLLGPHFDDGDVVGPRWSRWLHWLRTRRLAVAGTIDTIQPLSIAERVERIVRDRWSRHRHSEIGQGRCVSAGLEPWFVKAAFAWLLRDPSLFTSNSAESRESTEADIGSLGLRSLAGRRSLQRRRGLRPLEPAAWLRSRRRSGAYGQI
jgi:hypothetical protein